MEALFSAQYQWLWTIALGVMLFFPVRQLIWVMSVRRAESQDGNHDEARRDYLRKRASVTAGLLCFLVAILYVQVLFHGKP